MIEHHLFVDLLTVRSLELQEFAMSKPGLPVIQADSAVSAYTTGNPGLLMAFSNSLTGVFFYLFPNVINKQTDI